MKPPLPSTTSTTAPVAGLPLTDLTAPPYTSGLPALKSFALPPVSVTTGALSERAAEQKLANRRERIINSGAPRPL